MITFPTLATLPSKQGLKHMLLEAHGMTEQETLATLPSKQGLKRELCEFTDEGYKEDSRYTSIKTRIETLSPSSPRPMAVVTLATLPSKQGLKHRGRGHAQCAEYSRYTSIKTRIETGCRHGGFSLSCALATLPSKQGLKRDGPPRPNRLVKDSRYTSIKTRIET